MFMYLITDTIPYVNLNAYKKSVDGIMTFGCIRQTTRGVTT